MGEVVLPIQKGFYIHLGEAPPIEIFWFQWVAQRMPNGQLYAVRKNPTFALLHRYLAEAKPSEIVLFRDGQSWNCRPENLWKMTRSEWGKLQAEERGL